MFVFWTIFTGFIPGLHSFFYIYFKSLFILLLLLIFFFWRRRRRICTVFIPGLHSFFNIFLKIDLFYYCVYIYIYIYICLFFEESVQSLSLDSTHFFNIFLKIYLFYYCVYIFVVFWRICTVFIPGLHSCWLFCYLGLCSVVEQHFGSTGSCVKVFWRKVKNVQIFHTVWINMKSWE